MIYLKNIAFYVSTYMSKGKILSHRSLHLSLCNQLSVSVSSLNSITPVDLAFDHYVPDGKTVSSVPIIILHGFLGSKQNWRSLAKVIAKKSERHVYTLDARNHGDSPHTDEFSISLMSSDLKYFLEKKKILEAIIIGHSMGGRTAIYFTITNQELVNKLVIVDISPNTLPIHSTLSPTYMNIMKEAITTVYDLTLYKARKAIDEYITETVPEVEIRQFLLTNLTEKNKRISWKPNLDALLKNFKTGVLEMPPLPSHYMGKTLFICGEKSPYVSEKDYPKIKTLFPKAEIVRIAGAGHWVHSEKPSEFIERLHNFI